MLAQRLRCLLLPAAAAIALGGLLVSASAASAAGDQPTGIIRVGVPAIAVAVDPVTDTGYSWAEHTSPLNVIDLATGKVTASITVPGESELVHQALAVDSDTNTLYMLNYFDGSVLVIDGATDRVAQTITGLEDPTAIAVDSATETVYTAQRSGGIAVIDGATGTVTGSVPAGLVTAMAVDSSTDTIYAAEPDLGYILVIDGATDSVAAHIADDSLVGGLADDPATDTLYAANGLRVTAYDGSTNAAAGSVAFTETANGIAVNPATGTVFAAVPDAGVLALISNAANAVTGSLSLTGANQVAVDPQTDTLLAVAGGETYVVALQSPAITSAGATFTVGEQRAVTIAATGTPAPDFTESGALPAGLKLTSDGTVTGTPQPGTAGDYQISVTAANGVAPAATQAFSIVVNQRPAFVSAGHVTFRARAEEHFTIRATGLPVPTVTERRKLPPGLRFRARGNGTAVISGRAARSAAGKRYVVILSASNNVGKPARQRLTIKVT